MEPRIHVTTLGVADLERSLAFYRDGLGLETPGIVEIEYEGAAERPAGAVAMFELQGGLILALYPRTELAKDAGIAVPPPGSGEFSIGHAVASREAVDALLRQAEAAGATLTGGPDERPWGLYSGHFRDPDGHLWEVLWNPEARDDHRREMSQIGRSRTERRDHPSRAMTGDATGA